MNKSKRLYEFEDFCVDVENKRLQRNGIPIALTPKVFDTLLILLENAPNLIEKGDLMQSLWQDRFVEESNLTFNIKMLRKALGDEAANPKFIETVPRRGYRFIAKLNENLPKIEEKKVQKTPVFEKNYWFGLILLVVFTSLTALAAWTWKTYSNKLNSPILSAEFNSIKLTDTGKVNQAVISPDGKYLAYTNEVSGKQSLWLRQLSGGTNVEIVSGLDEYYYGLAFANDSENIFFVRKTKTPESRPNIYKVSILGGNPIKIAENSEGKIAVSPDDKQILFIRYEKGFSNQNNLMTIDVDGKNEKIIKTSEAPKVFWTAIFSPDTTKIVASYGSSNNASQEVDLIEINTETGEKIELTDQGFFQIGSLVWLKNQDNFLFTAHQKLGEPSRIWSYDYKMRKAEAVTKDTTDYKNLSLNKNADKLVATTLTADFGLFVGSNPNSTKYLTQARDGFAFAPDGKIVYAGDAAGSEDIWIMDENGSNQKQLTTDKALDAYPIVSADNQIYFASNRTGENQIWRMNSDGSNQIQLTKKSGGKPRFATTDGKWIYYESAINQTIWKVATDGSEETQLFPNRTGFYQTFSPDGAQMAYLSRNQETKKFEIAVVILETQKIINNFPIPEGKSHPYFLNWTADGKGLTYSMEDLNSDNLLWMQDLAENTPKNLFNLGKEDIMDCRLSPNSKNYVFIQGNWKHDAVLLSGLKY